MNHSIIIVAVLLIFSAIFSVCLMHRQYNYLRKLSLLSDEIKTLWKKGDWIAITSHENPNKWAYYKYLSFDGEKICVQPTHGCVEHHNIDTVMLNVSLAFRDKAYKESLSPLQLVVLIIED